MIPYYYFEIVGITLRISIVTIIICSFHLALQSFILYLKVQRSLFPIRKHILHLLSMGVLARSQTMPVHVFLPFVSGYNETLVDYNYFTTALFQTFFHCKTFYNVLWLLIPPTPTHYPKFTGSVQL